MRKQNEYVTKANIKYSKIITVETNTNINLSFEQCILIAISLIKRKV